MLPDGSYDAFVVEADDEDGAAGAVSLVLTIVGGDHKGEVVAVRAAGLGGTSMDLLGMPATLVVTDGAPTVSIDR